MKIKLLRNTVAGGRVVQVGQIVDVPEHEAKLLQSIGKAVLIDLDGDGKEDLAEARAAKVVKAAKVKKGKK